MANTLSFNDGGSNGTPVVFLHSLAGSNHHWESQLDIVRQNQRAIAVDLRGHGRSQNATSFTLEEMAADVAHTLKQLDIERFVLVGHSMGGAVAIKLTGMYPESVAGLVLADAAGDSTQIPKDQLEGLLAAIASPAYEGVMQEYWESLLINAAEPARQQLLAELAKMPKETVVSIFNELVVYNPLPDLARFDGPTLLISTPLTDAPFSLQALRPDLPHTRIENTSHWLQMDNSAEFNRHLEKFLALV